MVRIFSDFHQQLDTHYDRIKLLKSSARGRVSLLRHKVSGNRYLLRECTGDSAVYRRLLGIDCPYLPQILEIAEQEGSVSVLEEYIDGNNMAEMLEGCLFTSAEAKEILRQLCCGLWTLHSAGVIHRDIKPENVILQGQRAVLVDFDAARVYKTLHKADTQVLGTIGYAPPEQHGFSQTDERADIYALGVLLNVMLTGQHPAVRLASGKLGRVVQRCTMVAPQKRYNDVRHLTDAL